MNIILIIILLVIIMILIWALFGGRSDLTGSSGEEMKEQERTLRRRAADKEIEKEYPETGHSPRRRKTDPAEEAAPEQDKPFKLPYLADEIIPETSQFRIYRRTLFNSEIYASKHDYATAISLFEGVRSRIQDIDTRFKIDANIEYLKHYKKKKDEEDKKREEDARKGIVSGVSVNKGEIKITFGGSVPNAINLDSIPENINIGVIDPGKHLDMDSIVENVSEKLRGEITDVREEMKRLSESSPGLDPARGRQLAEDLGALKERVESMSAAQAGGALQDSTGGLSDLKSKILDLGKTIKDFTAKKFAETEREPALRGARFDSAGFPYGRPGSGGADAGPRQSVPEPSVLKEPGSSLPQQYIPGEKPEEDDYEFELLSEYGKEKDEDELSDEEIFRRILKEDKPKGKEDFEIIGEKKETSDEYVTTDEEMDKKQREDASFYKRLLRTNKRKMKELPILKVSYDFTKLPDTIGLSREKNIIEYAFYKYKPMLEKANEYIKKRKVRDAINYYKVVMSQNIPPEFKAMIRTNLNDLNEYLEKYLSGD